LEGAGLAGLAIGALDNAIAAEASDATCDELALVVADHAALLAVIAVGLRCFVALLSCVLLDDAIATARLGRAGRAGNTAVYALFALILYPIRAGWRGLTCRTRPTTVDALLALVLDTVCARGRGLTG